MMATSETANTTTTLQIASKKQKKKSVMYTNATLKKALDTIETGMPVSTASKLYNIPRTTLLYKKRGTLPSIIKNRGPECILGEEYERQLVQWIFYMSQSGFPVSRAQLLDSVELLLKQIKKTTVFTKNRPGKHWYNAFRARHKDLAERMSQNLTHSRASVTEHKLRAWFNEVRIYLESKSLLDIHPSRIFNCDESAFFLSPKDSKVLVKKGDKTVYKFISNDEKECLTTLICGSADGKIAPPMVIFSYKRIPGYIATNMPTDWSIGHSDNGWMTGETFYEYIANIFYPYLVKTDIMLPVVLFLDGHTSHLTMALSTFCTEKGIELVALYPNATHILQPLDVAFFHPLKTAWTKVVRQWRLENNGERIKRENFAQLLQKALETLDVKTILRNGFEKTGLHPFSADGISYQKYFKKSVDSAIIPQIIPNDRNENKDYLAFIENNIDKEVLQIFKDVGEAEWNGETIHESLFYFWRTIKNKTNSSEVNHSISGDTVVNEIHVAKEKRIGNDGIVNEIEEEQEKYKKLDVTVEDVPIVITICNDVSSVQNETVSNLSSIDVDVRHTNDFDPQKNLTVYEISPCETLLPMENQLNDVDMELIELPNECTDELTSPKLSPPKSQSNPRLNVPSPFKHALFWPSQDKEPSKKRRVKEKIPTVVTSNAWKQYHEVKAEKKRKEVEEKEMRKTERLKKAQLQKEQKEIAKQARMKQKQVNILNKIKKER